MAEREMIVHGQRITYEGLFSLDEVHKAISAWIDHKKYDQFDKLHTQSEKPEGKFIDIEMHPEKYIDDYTSLVIHIKIFASNVKDVTVEMDGRKRRLNQGKIQVVLDAFMKTDYQGRMESKPIYAFIRTVFDKYIYKSEMTRNEHQLRADLAHLHDLIANQLNVFKTR